jgi:hypothetical protein
VQNLPTVQGVSRVDGIAMAEPIPCDRPRAPGNQPVLAIEPRPGGMGWCVTACNLGRDRVAAMEGRAEPALHVKVVEAGGPDDDLPDISGDYDILGDGVRFIPHFTFGLGVLFRATLELNAPGRPDLAEVQTLEFSFPREMRAMETKVSHVFPSSDLLPENLLRLYIRFSNPMQRGRAAGNIETLGPDGMPMPDILYRPPVELWDRSMTCLTILLDPGRLKRSVGPNRALGPPLAVGLRYTLSIGTGMIDMYGRPLSKAFARSFIVTDAVRSPVVIGEWKIAPPAAGSHKPLELSFPRPLDWAQLWQGIAVTSATGQPIGGRIDIDRGETRWRFTPDEPWRAGGHRLCVSPDLEDICGNTPYGPFDAPFRSTEEVAFETAPRLVPFSVEVP